MAVLTKQKITDDPGKAVAHTAVASTDHFEPDEHTLFMVKNNSGAAVTVTFVTPVTHAGKSVGDSQVTVGAGNEFLFGPFPRRLYADPANDGLCRVNYSATASIVASVYSL